MRCNSSLYVVGYLSSQHAAQGGSTMASQLPANYDRAAEIARKDGLKIRPLGDDRYDVTRPTNGHVHTVTLLDGRLVCGCPASEHGRYCAHRAAVRIHLLADMAAREMQAARAVVV